MLKEESIKKLDPISELVVSYQKEPTLGKLLRIQKSTRGLIHSVFRYYGIDQYFPVTVREDIEDDCRSEVLLKCLRRYDASRGNKFTTLYTWWVKSFVNASKNWHLRRMKLLQTVSMSRPMNGDLNAPKLEECISSSTDNTLINFKREMSSIFELV